MSQKAISERLDACLLTDAEMEEYKAAAQKLPDAVSIDYDYQPPKPIDLRVRA
jgi:hypothetical protein